MLARRLAALSILVSLLFLIGSQATAQEAPTTTVATSSTVGSTTTVIVPQPAIPTSVPEPTPEKVDWTYRYLIPTSLVLGAAAIFFTALNYFLRVVRARYRVVK